MSRHQKTVGVSISKVDGPEKVTGRAKYIADLYRPNMLHAAMLQSSAAHARIRGYDISEALAVPGVRCVLTGDDFGDHKMGPFIKDEGPIAKGKILYFGEPVAVVAAEDEGTARRAAQLIKVDYDELPAVLTPEEALADDAPVLHENLGEYIKVFDFQCNGNQVSHALIDQGDIEKGFAEADVIIEGEFETQAQYHMSMEPCGALAELDGQGRVQLWSANQSVFRVQANVCECLGLPMSKVHSMTPAVGAGFGNKMEPHIQHLVVALTMATKRPVKMILSRSEDMETVRHRHPVKMRIRTGAKRDGTLVAREVEVLMGGGAFADDSPGVLGFLCFNGCGPYRIPNAKAHGRLAYTNIMRMGAFRGFGNIQIAFASESQIDEIAEKLGIDPIDIRLKNALREGDKWFGGQPVESSGLTECLEKIRDASGWARRHESSAPKGKRRALGVAACGHISGLLGTGAVVRMLEDGTIVLNTGAVDIGQGSSTILAQMCAETLKVPIENIVVATPDTDGSPYNWGTTGSRVTYTTGRAVVAASNDVVQKALQHASAILDAPVEDLELRDGGMVGVKGANREVSFQAISGRAHWQVGGPIIGANAFMYQKPVADPTIAKLVDVPFPQIGTFTFCANIVEVEIDEVTGKVDVTRVWYGIDAGRAINPCLVEGQVEGAFAQGLGLALYEEVVWDGPKIANPSLMDYKAPTAKEVTHDIHTIIVEHPEPDGPFGAKGAGEIPLVGIPAAIANAIAAAIGIRLRRLPMKPERVLTALLGSAQ